MDAGRIPKAIRSEKESICTPKSFSSGVRFFFVRATRPSKASHSPEKSMKNIP